MTSKNKFKHLTCGQVDKCLTSQVLCLTSCHSKPHLFQQLQLTFKIDSIYIWIFKQCSYRLIDSVLESEREYVKVFLLVCKIPVRVISKIASICLKLTCKVPAISEKSIQTNSSHGRKSKSNCVKCQSLVFKILKV